MHDILKLSLDDLDGLSSLCCMTSLMNVTTLLYVVTLPGSSGKQHADKDMMIAIANTHLVTTSLQRQSIETIVSGLRASSCRITTMGGRYLDVKPTRKASCDHMTSMITQDMITGSRS